MPNTNERDVKASNQMSDDKMPERCAPERLFRSAITGEAYDERIRGPHDEYLHTDAVQTQVAAAELRCLDALQAMWDARFAVAGTDEQIQAWAKAQAVLEKK